jgi:hypothetical protein
METDGTALSFTELNCIQLHIEEAEYALASAKKHLAFVPGFEGVKAKVQDATNSVRYAVNVIDKWEATND